MKKSTSGFTIVELLIVVVVIAILAAIAVAAYTGIQTRALNASRAKEITDWKKRFLSFQATNGVWPTAMVPYTTYCLGKGFPIGAGGVPRCRDYTKTTTGYLESDNDALMAEIETMSSIDKSTKTPPSTTVGPYAILDNAGEIKITSVFKGGSGDCPKGTVEQFVSVGLGVVWCEIRIQN